MPAPFEAQEHAITHFKSTSRSEPAGTLLNSVMTPVEALKAQPYFRPLAESEIAGLARRMVERTYAKDEMVFAEGDLCQGLYVVREGAVKVFKMSPEGREQVLAYVTAGGSFNEVAVFDGGLNPANVSTLEPSSICVVPREVILELIHQRPDVALAIIQNLGARLRQLVGLVEDLSLRQVTARLAKLLLETADGRERTLTQQEMAARLGTVREMIGRSLRQLEGRGLIKVKHGRTVITDRNGLEALV